MNDLVDYLQRMLAPDEQWCTECNGSGQRTVVRVTDTCVFCQGTGKVKKKEESSKPVGQA